MVILIVRGERISAVAAISSDGLTAVKLKKGTVDADYFVDFVRGDLVPNMLPFDDTNSKSIAIMDNCSIHHVQAVVDICDAAGILLLFPPPYSPHYNPIEGTFRATPRNNTQSCKYYMDDPMPIIRGAFNSITPEQCDGWISNSGYA